MLSAMIGAGFTYTGDPERAEVIIINTCAFVESAVAESVDTILDHKAMNEDALLVVAGCLPLRYHEDVTDPLPEVDLFVGPDQIADLPRFVGSALGKETERAVSRKPLGRNGDRIARGHPDGRKFDPAERTLTTTGYAYLKIAEGCSRNCAFCTIPSIRGRLASVDPDDLQQETEFLARAGIRELVLVAQDLTSYGVDHGEKGALIGLLERIGRVDGIRWIRLMYLHPNGIPSGLSGTINESDKILPYLDIPFQHISDPVLRRMGRPWKGDRLRKLVHQLRESIPGLVLRTTIMVGYPGEGEKQFAELRDFVESSQIEHVGVFTYSPEEGARSARLGDPVPKAVKEARALEIRQIHERFMEKRNRGRIGSLEQSLVEGVSMETDLLLQARTWDQAPEVDGTLYITAGNAMAGEIHSVRITGYNGPDLFGEVIE